MARSKVVKVTLPEGKPSPVGKVIPGFGVEREVAPGITEVTLDPGVMERIAAQVRADDAAPFITDCIQEPGSFDYMQGTRRGTASFPLFLIRMAWEAGLDLEEDADGFGYGEGTHGDWSAIRDSSDGAIRSMLGKSLTFISRRLKGRR